jgi:RHS repeat-associated protein
VTTSYSYDAAGRLSSLTAASKTTSYGYDATGNLTTQTNPNGTTVTRTFNAADELTSLTNKKSDNTTLSQFSDSYNSDGLRSQLSETLGTQTATVTYTYDTLHRLKDEVRTGGDAYQNHFTYDAAGNRLTWNDGFGTTTYTYDAADRLTQAGNTSYTYNANGSRLTKTLSSSTTSYSYDYDEQLTQVVSPLTGTSSFTYDGLGRRVSRTNGGTTTTFSFSGNSITTEKQGSTVTAHYVYGNNRVSRDAGGSYEYYHNDGIGSTRQISNDSQSLTQTTTYDAFGNIESSAGSSNNAYRYAGQWGYRNDGDDGLMHVGARYYDPLVGRFVQADTHLGEMGNPQSLNRYNYCEGDPVNHVDPTGFSRLRTWWNKFLEAAGRVLGIPSGDQVPEIKPQPPKGDPPRAIIRPQGPREAPPSGRPPQGGGGIGGRGSGSGGGIGAIGTIATGSGVFADGFLHTAQWRLRIQEELDRDPHGNR